jgi:hypothetical protein
MRPSRIAFAVAAALLLGPLVANASVKPVPASCEIPTTDGSCVRVLYAGQKVEVGRVEVRREGTRALVVYRVIDPRWTLIETHLYAANTPPTTNAPGQFPYKHEWINTSVDSYRITLGSAEECLYVAAHGIVAKVTERQAPNLDQLALTLPQATRLQVESPGEAGVDSYFDATLDGVDLSLLDGTYDAWCADAKLEIAESELHEAAVYSSYEPLPEGLPPDEDNLDLVNWVINQDWEGEGYTWQQVQCALWKLMGTLPEGEAELDFVCGSLDFNDADENRKADEIVVLATRYGESYVPPTCDALIGLLLVPPTVAGTPGPQPVLAQVPIAQLGSFCFATYDAAVTETVWGCGDTRLRGGWGSYFECGGQGCSTSSTSPTRRRLVPPAR